MVQSFLRPHAQIAGGALCDTALKPCVRKTVQLSFRATLLCRRCEESGDERSVARAERSAGTTMLPRMRGGQSAHPVRCVLNDYDALRTSGGIEVLWFLTLTR